MAHKFRAGDKVKLVGKPNEPNIGWIPTGYQVGDIGEVGKYSRYGYPEFIYGEKHHTVYEDNLVLCETYEPINVPEIIARFKEYGE